MSRKARKIIDGKYFHVMVQGIAQENIFPDDDSKGYYLACIKKAKEKHCAKILAFCVMSNHSHLLMSVNGIDNVTEFMSFVNTLYARYYNNENNRIGYVFRDRFKSELIDKEKYLLNCLAYIHNNPVKAGMIKRAEDYKYSSYINYLTKRGIVDFAEAKKYYDITPANIKAIMKEKSHSDWLEHEDKIYEKSKDVLDELMARYNISSNKLSYNLAAKMSKELIERCGISLRKSAGLLGVGRERLRQVMSAKK